MTGAFRKFLERYVFCNFIYDAENQSVLERGPGIGLIYTMGIPEKNIVPLRYDFLFNSHAMFLKALKGPFIEQIYSCDTLQFDDYGKYHAPMFDPDRKKKSREESFPKDLSKARELGRRLGRLTELPRLAKDALPEASTL